MKFLALVSNFDTHRGRGNYLSKNKPIIQVRESNKYTSTKGGII